jgi:ribosome-binding factor A
MSSPFLRRANETLREVIADEITRLTDPGLGFVTITGVDTAPDLRSARVFYSVLGDEDQAGETARALGRAAAHLRAAVGRRVRLKYTPELRFEPDSGIEHGMRIERLLAEIRAEDGRSPEGGGS